MIRYIQEIKDWIQFMFNRSIYLKIVHHDEKGVSFQVDPLRGLIVEDRHQIKYSQCKRIIINFMEEIHNEDLLRTKLPI